MLSSLLLLYANEKWWNFKFHSLFLKCNLQKTLSCTQWQCNSHIIKFSTVVFRGVILFTYLSFFTSCVSFFFLTISRNMTGDELEFAFHRKQNEYNRIKEILSSFDVNKVWFSDECSTQPSKVRSVPFWQRCSWCTVAMQHCKQPCHHGPISYRVNLMFRVSKKSQIALSSCIDNIYVKKSARRKKEINAHTKWNE